MFLWWCWLISCLVPCWNWPQDRRPCFLQTATSFSVPSPPLLSSNSTWPCTEAVLRVWQTQPRDKQPRKPQGHHPSCHSHNSWHTRRTPKETGMKTQGQRQAEREKWKEEGVKEQEWDGAFRWGVLLTFLPLLYLPPSPPKADLLPPFWHVAIIQNTFKP